MRHYNKTDAIRIVGACAKQYKEQLVDRALLFICLDKHRKVSVFQFTFDASNFLHLTGLQLVNRKRFDPGSGAPDPNAISATDFFRKCLDGKLRDADFDFARNGTTPLKLEVLPTLMTQHLSAKMIGDFHSDKPRLETDKLAGGQTACMGFVKNRGTGPYVPNTVIKEDIRKQTLKPQRVAACFRKSRRDARFSEVTYLGKNIDWNAVQLPAEYAYLKELLTVSV